MSYNEQIARDNQVERERVAKLPAWRKAMVRWIGLPLLVVIGILMWMASALHR